MDVSSATADETSLGRVLLAEDDVELRRLLASTLRSDGYEVDEAATGFELLARASGQRVNVIVSDVRMPGLTGLEVLAGLRAQGPSEIWNTPVILITAFGDSETYLAAESLGAILFNKPFDLDDLRTCVMNLLNARKDSTWQPRDHR